MFLLGFLGTNFVAFIGAGVCIGFRLASLFGAPIRIVLRETPPAERAASQEVITIATGATGVGQLVSGAVAASQDGGVNGYTSPISLWVG